MLVTGTPPAMGGFNGAWSVAYDQSGNLYASDYFNDRVEKFDSNGNFVCQFGSYGTVAGSFEFPRGIAVSPDGSTIAVTQEANTVQLFNSNCTYKSQITVAGGLKRPRQVTFDPSNDGSIWIADYNNNRVLHVSSTGAVLLTINDGGAMKSPQGVVVDASGNVYVADSGNNAIEEYSSTGTLIATLATNGSGPGQVSIPSELALVGPAGHQILLVADQGNNRIIGIPIGTVPAVTFGSLGSGAGQLNTPESIAYNPLDGAIAVADFGNSRVSLWGPTAQEVISPSPIAPTASLAPNATVNVTVTAETGDGTPTPGVTVWLSFNPTAGGGSAMVGATTLTSTPQAFTADANGDVTVTYMVPSSPPATGSDVVTAQNALSPTFSSTDGYAFG
jgi:DNA-binding beta-propeller fold protein YncE